MTDWLAIIERAAYTRFCKTGSLEPFRLHWEDLCRLALQVSGASVGLDPKKREAGVMRVQVSVPVSSIGKDAWVVVDEWTQ